MNKQINESRGQKPSALITGASSGIGESFTNKLAAQGYNLVLVARREDKLEELAKSIREVFAVKVTVIAADLSDPNEPQRIFESLQDQNIDIEVLINSAGLALAKPFVDSIWQEQQDLMNVMMISLTRMCHLFSASMKEQGRGYIINVASMAAFAPELPGNLYSATKAFVVHMSEALDLELKPLGVNCLALCPGLTRSEFHETMGIKEALSIIPQWRWMDADKVADEGLNAVMGGRHIHVNGKLNRVLVNTFKLMPKQAKYFLGSKGIIL